MQVRVHVVFELPASLWADHIYLVGDFNDWNRSATPFALSGSGVWRAELDLPLGQRYEFRYWVDGNWETDCQADGWIRNKYGSQNSVVETVLPA